MSPVKKADAVRSLPDYEARARVAAGLLQCCRPERYLYLAFAALAAAGVLASLYWIIVDQQAIKLGIGALGSCTGMITLTGYRILRIQSVVFNAVFGTKL